MKSMSKARDLLGRLNDLINEGHAEISLPGDIVANAPDEAI
jgi:hypothetical protein